MKNDTMYFGAHWDSIGVHINICENDQTDLRK